MAENDSITSEKEIWLPVLGHELAYEISASGLLRRVFKNHSRIVRGHINGRDTGDTPLDRTYHLSGDDRIVKSVKSRDLVAEAFYGIGPNL